MACIQGYRIHPPKPLPVPTATVNPILADGTPDLDRLRYEALVSAFRARRDQATASFEDRTDYAVALIGADRAAEAISVLVALEAERPDVYTTAANLGTAYELTGNLSAALTWISVGIERNPDSHHGTEWLHLAILRAKAKLQLDTGWLAKNSVLDEADPHRPEEIVRAIEYQLGERTHFVKPTDAVVCDLYYQAARLVTGDDSEGKRDRFAKESLRYGDWRRAEVTALVKSRFSDPPGSGAQRARE
jgi:hypothetical protein